MSIRDSISDTRPRAHDERWLALANHTGGPDAFYYGVKTTGVFCRPNCRSRLPNRQNVWFFATPAEALAAGFRPCKRCQPGGTDWEEALSEKVSRACRLIEQADDQGSLGSLAKSVGLSVSHFHRLFKRCLGVTPKAYKAMHRMNRFRRELHRREDVTAALYGAGFGSASRAYDGVAAKLGMTPRQYLKGGPGVVIAFALQKTSLGWLLVALSERGVCAIELGGSARELRDRLGTHFPHATLHEDRFDLAGPIRRVVRFLDAPKEGLSLPLDIRGTAFQRRVWQALQAIPPGKTLSYQAIAREIGHPGATRAVGSACAANRLALAIPCHRAVRQDGTLGGYRWGVARKRALLDLEKPVPGTSIHHGKAMGKKQRRGRG
ncbi:MAG TPA: bifunctional DNA-binding transcriptional regulator/O6-methylguanine-DNA methyltransferase Ada [Verrucomicrobiae bacterium]